MSAPHIDIHRIATLSRLKLSDAEATQYAAQLGNILNYVGVLEKYDLSSVEPSAHAMPVFDVWREDTPTPSFTADQALSNAPRKTNDQFVIAKVVE